MPELIDTDTGSLIICRTCQQQDAWDRDSTRSTEHFMVAVFDDELVQVRCRECKQVGMFDL